MKNNKIKINKNKIRKAIMLTITFIAAFCILAFLFIWKEDRSIICNSCPAMLLFFVASICWLLLFYLVNTGRIKTKKN